MDRLMEESVRHAGEHGASVIEAYPVALRKRRVTASAGSFRCFAAHGFSEVARAGLRRHVMRRSLE